MTFQKVRYISYAVPSFHPYLAGAVGPVGGAPTIQLEDADLQARAQRLVNVIWWAQGQADSAAKPDDQTLTVFIAPEFYFRQASAQEVASGEFSESNNWGGYDRPMRDALASELYRAIGQAKNLHNWLIVAGTVFTWHGEGLLNTAIALRGPRATDDGAAPYVLIEKHQISNIDGPKPNAHANRNDESVFSHTKNRDPFLDNLIYWDGMLMGIEVCLDHSLRAVAMGMEELNGLFPSEARQLALQLVTSCGMSIKAPAVAVANGDLVLLTDGMTSRNRTPNTQAIRATITADNLDLTPCARPTLQVLDASPNYSVTYPDYLGQQGIYIYATQPLQQA